MEFTATVELNGKTATGIEVSAEVMAELGGQRVPVTINGHGYQSAVGSMGGRSLIPTSAEHRSQAGCDSRRHGHGHVGTRYRSPDHGPAGRLGRRAHGEPQAQAFFDCPAASYKKESTCAG